MAYLVQGRKDPGQILGGSDQIDVMGALLLQAEEDIGQSAYAQLLSQIFLTDGMVLAETAAQGASAEKYGSTAPGSADAGLLPVVKPGPSGPHIDPAPAIAPGIVPVHMAPAGAEAAVCQAVGRDKKRIHKLPFSY